jgi:hypothetical protein
MSKKDFDFIINQLFTDIQNGITTINENDFKTDMKIYFNKLTIDKALVNCVKLKNYGQIYSNIKDCEDTIYFYRATKENNYCSKITKKENQNLCYGFIDYLNKK